MQLIQLQFLELPTINHIYIYTHTQTEDSLLPVASMSWRIAHVMFSSCLSLTLCSRCVRKAWDQGYKTCKGRVERARRLIWLLWIKKGPTVTCAIYSNIGTRSAHNRTTNIPSLHKILFLVSLQQRERPDIFMFFKTSSTLLKMHEKSMGRRTRDMQELSWKSKEINLSRCSKENLT